MTQEELKSILSKPGVTLIESSVRMKGMKTAPKNDLPYDFGVRVRNTPETTKQPRKNNKGEESMQLSVCNYIHWKYPYVFFSVDVAAGMKLTMGQAVKAKKMRNSRGQPDVFIAKPKYGIFGDMFCAGLFLELKKAGTVIHLKNGGITADPHIREQLEVLKQLEAAGYKAVMVCGLDEAINVIDEYLS